MASNDYYNSGHGGYNSYNTNNHQDDIYEASPYQSNTVPVSYPPPAAHSPPPPSYTTEANPGAYGQRYDAADTTRPPNNTNTSPFDTVFDDHVYPVGQGPNSSSNSMSQTAFPPSHQNSTTAFAHDTGYHGAGTGAYSNDDIPLQDRTNSKPDMGNDHVYDAEPGFNQQAAQKRSRVRFGELGMWGANKKRIPFVVYIFTAIQLGVFIAELVKNSQQTGSPIMTKPSFNPMIGPSPYILINMGARFVPCMHDIDTDEIPKSVPWPCPNTTSSDSSDANNQCMLGELCGFNAPFTNDNPSQWYRFVLPIFMHAGIIHIGFNLLLQLTIGRELETAIGPVRFFLVYMSAGIFGFVMGGNYGGTGFASTGASGSLFGIIALTLLDLLYSWRERKSPVRELITIIVEMVISFVLGLLPGLDNFAHIGGFVMGLALGISVLHSPNALRARIGDDTPYTSMAGATPNEPPGFLKNPVGFFKGRKPLWWGWWLIRAGALILVIVGFILLLQNFYVTRNTCSWCKYLSCIPINDWCENQNLSVTTSDTDSS
ncbi:uncharacterized protein MKZ38_007025 [Zalerion maritima]|uniref:Rhomboid-type serine protease n=1 Tax=Zalerion maritima TaxID=339359 RepID=A0AAD5RX21_9PEZI|nr:uncharacterized protein MKZ38_007025 [Zalerion maritima]